MPDSTPDPMHEMGPNTPFAATVGHLPSADGYVGYVRFHDTTLNLPEIGQPWCTPPAPTSKIALWRATRHWTDLTTFAQLFRETSTAHKKGAHTRP